MLLNREYPTDIRVGAKLLSGFYSLRYLMPLNREQSVMVLLKPLFRQPWGMLFMEMYILDLGLECQGYS